MSSHSSPFHRAAEAPTEDTAPSPEELSRKQDVIAQLKTLRESTLGNDLVSLGMVRNLQVVDDYVYLRLYVGRHQLDLQELVQTALGQLPWCKKAYAQLCTIPGCAPRWRCRAARVGWANRPLPSIWRPRWSKPGPK
jgi:ATP-binding protein involved in chromosome partitioning